MIPKIIRQASGIEQNSLAERGLKLSEEVGEVAAEIFKLKGKKRTEKSGGEIIADLKEEAVDALIMCYDILAYVGASDEEIDALIQRKVKKWLDNTNTPR